MGLDVYVGSLTRYHSGNWELIAQKVARELGMDIQVIRQEPGPAVSVDPGQIRDDVLRWRDSLTESLRQHLVSSLNWDERSESPYFTDKPTWECYADLLLWAAYDEQHRLRRPEQHVEDWSEDPAYRISSGSGAQSLYSHLYDVSAWLPCDFEFLFDAKDIAGVDLRFGSSVKLLAQLATLNERTWQASAEELDKWRKDGAEHGVPLEVGARFAFALFYALAAAAVDHNLPTRLDW